MEMDETTQIQEAGPRRPWVRRHRQSMGSAATALIHGAACCHRLIWGPPPPPSPGHGSATTTYSMLPTTVRGSAMASAQE